MEKKNKNAIALTAALGMFPVALDSTIVNVALVPISKALNTDFNTIQWIFIGYLLANAAVVSLSGYFANRFGSKRLFLIGLALFTLTSTLCTLAPNETWLIALRVLQGIGGGVLIPIGMAIAINPFSQEERVKATALVGVPLMLAPVLGPIIGGLMIDGLGWQSIFYVNLPVGLLALVLAWLVLPKDEIEKVSRRNFDYLGLVLTTGGIIAVIYAFKLVSQINPDSKTALNPKGDIYNWSYWLVWVLIGIGGALLLASAVNALWFSKDPVLDFRLFKHYDSIVSNLVIWLAATVSFGVMSLIPQFLQQVRLPNLSALDAGLALLPMGLGSIAGMIVGGGLYHKIGARIPVVIGAGLFTLGFWQLSNLTPTTSAGDIWIWLFLLGLSVTMTMVPAQTLAIGGLKDEALNKASSLLNSSKLLMASVGSTILVTLMIQFTTDHANTLRDELMRKAAATGVAPDQSARTMLAAQAGTSGMNDLYTILIYMAVTLIVLALALPSRKPAAPPLDTTEQPEETREMVQI
jgi:EmrB/QacA subfamily drug resistance transporter